MYFTPEMIEKRHKQTERQAFIIYVFAVLGAVLTPLFMVIAIGLII